MPKSSFYVEVKIVCGAHKDYLDIYFLHFSYILSCDLTWQV